MAVLVRRRLDKTHRGKVTRACRVPEIGQIVLMFRLVGLSDHVDRSWRQVMGIGRLLVILKRLMVRNIVERRETSHGSVIGSADRRAVRVPSSRAKAAMEPSPGDALLVEQIADISPRQGDEILAAGQAVFESRTRIADHGSIDYLRV